MSTSRAQRVHVLRDLLERVDGDLYVQAMPGGNLLLTTARRTRPADSVGHIDMATGDLVTYGPEEAR